MIIHICDFCKTQIDPEVSKTGHLNVNFDNTVSPAPMTLCQGCYGKIMGLVKKEDV